MIWSPWAVGYSGARDCVRDSMLSSKLRRGAPSAVSFTRWMWRGLPGQWWGTTIEGQRRGGPLPGDEHSTQTQPAPARTRSASQGPCNPPETGIDFPAIPRPDPPPISCTLNLDPTSRDPPWNPPLQLVPGILADDTSRETTAPQTSVLSAEMVSSKGRSPPLWCLHALRTRAPRKQCFYGQRHRHPIF